MSARKKHKFGELNLTVRAGNTVLNILSGIGVRVGLHDYTLDDRAPGLTLGVVKKHVRYCDVKACSNAGRATIAELSDIIGSDFGAPAKSVSEVARLKAILVAHGIDPSP